MSNLMIILGNGFTIDLLDHLESSEKINTRNLFANGDIVMWPDGSGERGFLSYKNCRNLWNLGARPNISDEEAYNLIEDIISCANMWPNDSQSDFDNNIYINAYYELVVFLKHLFVYYDSIVKDNDLSEIGKDGWGWLDLIRNAYKNPDYENIFIITYNYDVFLERLLKVNCIDFDMPPIIDNANKIKILKPHGSISFCHKEKNERETFGIRRSRVMYEAKIDDFQVDYDNMDENYLVNALIPPSGDSSRLTYKWADELRNNVREIACKINNEDLVVLSGLSYWHVDRKEIDDVLANINMDTSIYMINPSPPRALNAVLTSRFEKYILYLNSDNLGEIL